MNTFTVVKRHSLDHCKYIYITVIYKYIYSGQEAYKSPWRGETLRTKTLAKGLLYRVCCIGTPRLLYRDSCIGSIGTTV